jgi:hypothetical protein
MEDEISVLQARLAKAEEALVRIASYDESVEAEDCPILRGIARAYFVETRPIYPSQAVYDLLTEEAEADE